MVEVTSELLASGGNRHPAAADWDPRTGLLAYGSSCNIALWRPQQESPEGVHALLKAHESVVNAVKFAYTRDGATQLVAGSADGSVAVARLQGLQTFQQLPKTHSKSINAFAVSVTSSESRTAVKADSVLVSASADGTLGVWGLAEEESQLIQQITLKPNFIPLTLALVSVGGGYALAVAGTRSFIQIYTADSVLGFKLVATLSGHEGWIRSLSFVREADDGLDLLLASASQDKYIRLWRLHQGQELPPRDQDAAEPLLGSITKSLSNKAHKLSIEGVEYSITFEALLLGHEDWIYTVQWHKQGNKIRLLSASADNSVSIWEADPSSGVWVATVRLGEMSQQKGATTATGSTGGFWIGLWSPDGNAVVSLGRTGSWRYWKHQSTADMWDQDVSITGHVRPAQDVAWSTDGSYLVSTSEDQTTRIWAEWQREGRRTWHEISRAQIHGYDLNCVDSIEPTRFISGADEKLLRVFDQPNAVASLLQGLTGRQAASTSNLPDVASIPVLGLSNKSLGAEDEAAADEDDALRPSEPLSAAPEPPSRPPTEDQLARHLLWPESEKLYGHGYEISCVAASHDGKLVATACKATSIDHAVIRLYDTSQWREIKPVLTAHSLTCTSLRFSPTDKYLLSVGRDRQCAVFERAADESLEYTLLSSNPKAHTRMILDCAWAPVAAGHVFLSAGRDKNINVWKVQDHQLQRISSIPADHAVTAVDVLDALVHDDMIIAYGLEDGSAFICHVNYTTLAPATPIKLDRSAAPSSLPANPSKSITHLRWRPSHAHPPHLAIASEDTSVRILAVSLA